jgi:hypothetical protein
LFECDTEREDFKYSTAEASFQLSPGSPPLSLELIPTELIPHYGNVHRNTAPQPSPLPTLARDDQLSYISLMEKQSTTYHPLNNSSDPMQATLCSVPSISSQPPVVFTGTRKPDTCHYPVEKEHQLDIQKNPTADRATNTGRSLLSLDDSGEVSIPNRVLPLHEEASGEVTTLCGEVSTTLPEEVSIKTVTDSSVLASGLINLDLCSFAPSSETFVGGNKMHFYKNMLASVEELLQASVEVEQSQSDSCKCVTCGEPCVCKRTDEPSVLPVPHILHSTPCRVESTLDETASAADAIAMKYLEQGYADQPLPYYEDCHVLDVGRLRSLPKLL